MALKFVKFMNGLVGVSGCSSIREKGGTSGEAVYPMLQCQESKGSMWTRIGFWEAIVVPVVRRLYNDTVTRFGMMKTAPRSPRLAINPSHSSLSWEDCMRRLYHGVDSSSTISHKLVRARVDSNQSESVVAQGGSH